MIHTEPTQARTQKQFWTLNPRACIFLQISIMIELKQFVLPKTSSSIPVKRLEKWNKIS